MPYSDGKNKQDFIRVNFKKNAHFLPFYKEKVDPSREKIHDLSQKKGIRKLNKNRPELTKTLSTQYKMFNEQEQS
jgi:hypothetical protein